MLRQTQAECIQQAQLVLIEPLVALNLSAQPIRVVCDLEFSALLLLLLPFLWRIRFRDVLALHAGGVDVAGVWLSVQALTKRKKK